MNDEKDQAVIVTKTAHILPNGSANVSVVSMDTDDEFDVEFQMDVTESCPDIYRCPITRELMTKPVMLHEDGQSYDETALKEWLSENNRSPFTGKALTQKSYSRNYTLQHAIEQFETEKSLPKQDEEEKTIELNQYQITPPNNTNYEQLTKFLTKINLRQYTDVLMNEGFVSMQDFENIKFGDLIAMNIPIIHSRRLVTEIAKYNNEQMNEAIEPKTKNEPLTKSIIIRPGKIPKSKNKAPLNCNILLLGDAYVGKTSLRKRLELDDFVLTQATQGVELTCLKSNFRGEDLQITIWDPAGQERYAPITKTFFRKAHAAAIIFSADDSCTWKHVEYWMNELEQNAPDDIEAMLICNKIDLLQNELNDENESKNENEKSIELSSCIKNAVQVAAEKRFPFYMTSAKSGERVQKAFEELVSQVLNNDAILQKLYRQRDAPSVRHNYRNNGDDDDDDSESKYDDGTPTKKGKKKQLNKLKHRLSWRSRRNSGQEYKEYTDKEYDSAVNLQEKWNKDDSNRQSSSCCSKQFF